MAPSSYFTPQLFIAFTLAFYGLAGVADASPDRSSSLRARPALSIATWQGGPSATAKAKRPSQRVANRPDKRAAKKAKRAKRAERRARKLAKYDLNKDRKLEKRERANRKRVRLSRLDTNHDGVISRIEKRAGKAKRRRARKNRS